MNKLINFLKENYLIVVIGLLFYSLFLYYTVQGNRLCDCESTENYKPTRTGHTSVSRFYHK
ncbi:MAG: hypothetical protein J0L86_14645 [Flavobacteriales bacterium]|nr:hypothetical protein [Flavobacteriales bacterium]